MTSACTILATNVLTRRGLMHILIKDSEGKFRVRKKSDIRDIYTDIGGTTFVCFNGAKNTPIKIKETVEDFFNIYLAK